MPSALTGQSASPDECLLERVTGRNYALWVKLREHMDAVYDAVDVQWKFYGPKTGWLAGVAVGARNMFFLVPLQGAFTFADHAVERIVQGRFPVRVVKVLKEARRYIEGRSLQIDIENDADVRLVKRLVEIKRSARSSMSTKEA